MPEFLYSLGSCGVKYEIKVKFNPTPNNEIFRADVSYLHSGIGSSPSIDKLGEALGEAYFPGGLYTGMLGIILVNNIILSTQKKTFQRNQDLINCLLAHHKSFLERNKDLARRLEEINANSVLVGKILSIN